MADSKTMIDEETIAVLENEQIELQGGNIHV